MEVKIIRKIDNLPNVFLDSSLNKFSIVKDYINCGKYISRSGLTFNGCLKIVGDRLVETKGIYYIRNGSIISLEYRQKAIRSLDDIKQILGSLGITKVSPKQPHMLVKYDNYSIEIFDIYTKGHTYEFPLLQKQGHLNVYEVPPIKFAYNIEYQGDQKIERLNEELFKKAKEFTIYNHKIEFENEVLIYKHLYVTPGSGELVYIPESMMAKIESPDHDMVGFSPFHDTWLLFSHPRPRRTSGD